MISTNVISKPQHMSQPSEGFGSILTTSQRNSNHSSNRFSNKQRAEIARQQSLGGQLSESMVAGLLKMSQGDNVHSLSEEKAKQVAQVDHSEANGNSNSNSNSNSDSNSNNNNKRKQSNSTGNQRGRRHLAGAPKNSDISEEEQTTMNGVNKSSDNKKSTGKNDLDNTTSERDENQVKASALVETSSAEKKPFKVELVWRNIILFIILHSSFPIGTYMLITQRPWATLAFSIFGMYACGIGITAGTHRLWSHRAYKASWPVQAFLMYLQTMAGQNSIYTWSRDHRVHHKFSETDADPHNIKRGFFFAHMGWLCCKKHPDVREKGKVIDMSDLEANPLVMFQHRHFWWLSALITVLIPTMIPVYFWGERFWTSFVFSFMIRYLISLHSTWLVNSAAHYYGSRPYDAKIEARESPYVIYNGLGEGFHNYHHTFPYDYATSEFGRYFNITTAFIDFCAWLGLAKDRRKVDAETIMKRRLRTGEFDELEKQELVKDNSNGNCKNDTNKVHSNKVTCRKSAIQKAIDELEDGGLVERSERTSNPLAPLSNIIHELPYISGLTSMKYTM